MTSAKEVREAYKKGETPNCIKMKMTSEEVARDKEIREAYKRGETPASLKEVKDSEGIVTISTFI